MTVRTNILSVIFFSLMTDELIVKPDRHGKQNNPCHSHANPHKLRIQQAASRCVHNDRYTSQTAQQQGGEDKINVDNFLIGRFHIRLLADFSGNIQLITAIRTLISCHKFRTPEEIPTVTMRTALKCQQQNSDPIAHCEQKNQYHRQSTNCQTMNQRGSFWRGRTVHAPVVKFRKTASYRNQQNALKKSTIPCNEIHSSKMLPFITDKLFLCRLFRHDHLPPQECHTCTAGRKTKERVQTGKSRKTSMDARCFAFAKPALPLWIHATIPILLQTVHCNFQRSYNVSKVS